MSLKIKFKIFKHPIRLHSSKDLAKITELAKDRKCWRGLTSQIEKAAEVSQTNNWVAKRQLVRSSQTFISLRQPIDHEPLSLVSTGLSTFLQSLPEPDMKRILHNYLIWRIAESYVQVMLRHFGDSYLIR